MADDLRLCTAAFFRSRGKTVVTESEFLMGVSMNMRWMTYTDAETLLSLIIRKKLAEKDGEYIRPRFDVGSIDVPVGYRPPADILSVPTPTDPFQALLSDLSGFGVDRKEFLSRCRVVQKKMDLEIEAAALIVLREMNVDVTAYVDEMYRVVSER